MKIEKKVIKNNKVTKRTSNTWEGAEENLGKLKRNGQTQQQKLRQEVNG